MAGNRTNGPGFSPVRVPAEKVVWSFDSEGNVCVNIPHCVTGEDLKLEKQDQVLTGIKFPGDETIYQPDEDGCVTLPGDLFTTGSVEDNKLTLNIPGNAPVEICLTCIEGAALVDGEGNVVESLDVIDQIIQIPDTRLCWGVNGAGNIVLDIPNCTTGEQLEIPASPVLSVSGPGVDNTDPQRPVIGQSSVSVDPAGGTFTHTSAGGTPTVVDACQLTETCKPSLSQVEPGVFRFDDGHGGGLTFDINEVDFDVNGVSVNNGLIRFVSENENEVTIDLCAVMAANCNSPMVINADGSVTYTDNARNVTTIPAPAVLESSDSSVTVTPTPGGYDLAVDPVDPKTIESTDASVTVTATATGCDLSVDIPDPVTVESTDSSVTVTPTPGGYDLAVGPVDPKTIESTDASVIVTATATGCDLSVDIPDAVTVESTDSSVTVTPTPGGYDLAVDPVDPKTIESTDASVTVTSTATGCDLSVEHPDPVTVQSTDNSVAINATATGYDLSVEHPDPKTVESADGTVTVTATATGFDISVGVVDSSVATVAGVDRHGRAYEAGDVLMELANGEVVCIPGKSAAEPVTADAVNADRGSIIDFADSPQTFNLSDNDTACSAGVTTYELIPGDHVNVDSIGNFDASTGQYDVVFAADGLFEIHYRILCDGVEIDRAIDSGAFTSYVKSCAILPDNEADVSLDPANPPSSLQLSTNGNTYATDFTALFHTKGGTLLASGSQAILPTNSGPYELFPGGASVNGNASSDALIYYNRNDFNGNTGERLGLHMGDPGANGGSNSGIVNEFGFTFNFTNEIGAVTNLDINGCSGGVALTEVSLHDVDNNSEVQSMSRIWDRLENPLPLGASADGQPVDNGNGNYSFQSQDNAYLFWDEDLANEDSVSMEYRQNSADGLLAMMNVRYTLPVCVWRHPNTNEIVRAETIDGVLDSSEYPNLV